jgi:hypothetical protein
VGVLSCLVISGCSTTRFLYDQLDWLIIWRLNGFFSLDEEQEQELRRIVKDTLEWVRVEQLPQYAVFLRAASQEFREPVTVEILARRAEEMTRLFDAFLVHIVPDTAAFLASLNRDQIDELLENLEDNNQELWDEYAGRSPERRQQRRERAAIKNSQRFTGRLNADQRLMIRTYTSSMHDVALEWIDGRRVWQQEFRALLQQRPPPAEYEAHLTTLFLDPNRGDAPDYREKVDQNRLIILQMSAELVNGLTNKQRDRLIRRLNNYARDFDALAARPSKLTTTAGEAAAAHVTSVEANSTAQRMCRSAACASGAALSDG